MILFFFLAVVGLAAWLLTIKRSAPPAPPRRKWTRVEIDGQYRHVWLDDEGNPTHYCSSGEPYP